MDPYSASHKYGRTNRLRLLGTLKNYGLAAGLALSLFSKEKALPAAVFMIFMMPYLAWLDFKLR